jgi:hypothetical protein
MRLLRHIAESATEEEALRTTMSGRHTSGPDAEGLCLWIQWTTTIATKPRLWRHVLRSHENEKVIEENHDLAFLTTFGRI